METKSKIALQKIHDMEKMHSLLNIVSAFPHVHKKIVTTWGTSDFRPYVETLLFKDVRWDRQGFPLKTFTAISNLLDLHDEKYPHLTNDKNLWDHE